MKQCPKCRVLKNSTHFHRHVKRCGTTEHRAQCPFCPKSYSRNDDLQKHIKQKHPPINGANAMMQICKRSKITYPRPCPKCGKEISRGSFFRHTKQCGATEHRYHALSTLSPRVFTKRQFTASYTTATFQQSTTVYVSKMRQTIHY